MFEFIDHIRPNPSQLWLRNYLIIFESAPKAPARSDSSSGAEADYDLKSVSQPISQEEKLPLRPQTLRDPLLQKPLFRQNDFIF